jgi:hypothetical protein
VELLDNVDTVFYSSPHNTLRYINSAIKAIANGDDETENRDLLMHSLTYGRDVKRLLLVNPNFVGNVANPFGKELFYLRISALIYQLQKLFPNNSLQLFSSTRSPANFLPSCYVQSLLAASFTSYSKFLAEVNLLNLKLSPFLQRLEGKQNDMPLTVWRYEDYPYIWREIVQVLQAF